MSGDGCGMTGTDAGTMLRLLPRPRAPRNDIGTLTGATCPSNHTVYSASLKFCRNDAGFNVFILPVDEPHESFGESVDELIFRFGIES